MFEGGRQAFGRAKCRMPISMKSSGGLPVGRGVRGTIHRQTMATVSEGHWPWRCPIRRARLRLTDPRRLLRTTAGEKVMELISLNIRPPDIVTRRALENAARW